MDLQNRSDKIHNVNIQVLFRQVRKRLPVIAFYQLNNRYLNGFQFNLL